MDNGSEFIANLTKTWSAMYGIEFKYIQPGKPTQYAYIERFNGTYRRGVLNKYIFEDIHQVRQVTEEWIHDYNNFKPHDALGNLPPRVYAKQNHQKGTLLVIDKEL